MNKIIKSYDVYGFTIDVLKTALLSRGSIDTDKVYRITNLKTGEVYFASSQHVPDEVHEIVKEFDTYEQARDWWNEHIEDAYSVVEHGNDDFLPVEWIEG